MLLTNRLNFFDKRGNEINLLPDPAVTVTVMEPDGGGGAVFNVYTNREGNIEVVEIVSGGTNYTSGVTYIRFENLFTGYVWDISPSNVVITGGSITAINGLNTGVLGSYPTENKGFPYPAVTWKGEVFFDQVSVGLIENQEVFVLEKVLGQANDLSTLGYSYPRADEGTANSLGFYRNEKPIAVGGNTPTYGIGSVGVQVYSYTGNISVGNNTIYGILSTANLAVGMIVEGNGIASETFITEIVSATSIKVSNTFTATITSVTIESYVPHSFVAGMKIRIGDNTFSLPISGVYDVNYVTPREIFFKTPLSLPTIPQTTGFSTSFFRAAPVWRGRMVGSEEEIFLFTVDYQEAFPVIAKSITLSQDPIDGDNLTSPDFYYTGGVSKDNAANGYQYRVVTENWEEKLMQFHLGFSAGTEGSYVNMLLIEDITFTYAPKLVAQISLRGEAAGEDERLGKLLENFGREITEQQELILRDSDVNEDLPNYLLLNKKRKEMLLQGDQIWPYLGSYKGIVNIVNWFGYYDMRIKEYWLNVNKDDVYYGKYKQIQIPFQLDDRATPFNSIDMVPSKVYKKTNKFGLFYDLNKESGVLDENGMPLTVDAFQFSNEEVLIKLFALKQYLVNTFLPLSAKIVDIVGEGVYYERYAANTWNDRVESLSVELTRSIDFKALDNRIPVEDARRFDTTERAYSYSPGTDQLQNYYNTYTVEGVTIGTPLVTVTSIPNLQLTTTTGNASPTQFWDGQAYVKALNSSYVLGPLSNGGYGYQIGDIITLGGGSYANPIRVKVTSVIPGGSVTTFDIVSGLDQGSRYLSLPATGFFQMYVISEDIVNNLYYSGVGTGFQLDKSEIQYQLEGVKTTTFGKGYPIPDPLVLLAIDPVTGTPYAGVNYSFTLKTVQGPYVGYFNEGKKILALTNEPNVPVGAFLDLETLGLEAYWNDMLFSWEALWGAEDATLKAYIDPLPAGSGSVLAIEIIDPGMGYNLTPSIQFAGGQGIGAAAQSKIVDGKLAIYNYSATTAVPLSPTTSRINFTFSTTPIPFSLGAMVTGTDASGSEIPKPATIIFIDPAGAYIDINQNYTAAGPLDIYIHEGAVVTTSGNGYVTNPDVKTVGGHTEILYTWEEIGRGNFYEMEWKVTLESGTAPFNYTSGRGSIDTLYNHSVQLPYKGLYKVELVIYDTENNWVNEIKRNYVEVYMPEASATLATRFIGPSTTPGVSDGSEPASMLTQLEQNCVDTWEEAFFHWDEYWGRWINPFKTWTTWNDCDIEWDTMNVTPLSPQNNWSYPVVPDYDVYRVSAYDNLIGTVLSFDPITGNVEVNYGSDEQQRPFMQAGEYVFFRRDDLVFQAEVTVTAALILPTIYVFTINTATNWPDNFEANPTAWEALREVKNTVVVQDDLYTPDNGKTVVPGQFITLAGNADTRLNNSRWNLGQPPYTWGIPIDAKLTAGGFDSGIEIPSAFANYDFTSNRWVNGQIYQYRNIANVNGSLDLFSSTTAALNGTVYIERLDSPTEYNWGNRGMIYINNTAGSVHQTTANPLNEIRPGFTIIDLVVGEPDSSFTETWDWLTSANSTAKWANDMVYCTSTSTIFFIEEPGGAGSYRLSEFDPVNPLTVVNHWNVPNPISLDYQELVYEEINDRLWLRDATGKIAVLNPAAPATPLVIFGSAIYVNSPMCYADSDNYMYIPDTTTGDIDYYDGTTYVSGGSMTGGSITAKYLNYDPVNKTLWASDGGISGAFDIWDVDPASPNYQTVITNVSSSFASAGYRGVYNSFTGEMVYGDAGTPSQFYVFDTNTYAETVYTIPFSISTGLVSQIKIHPIDGQIWIGVDQVFQDPLLNVDSAVYVVDLYNYNYIGSIDQGPAGSLGAINGCRSICYYPVNTSMFLFQYDPATPKTAEVKGANAYLDSGITLYEQHFRTINMYVDTSNQGHPWNIWGETNSEIICIEVETLDGKKFDEILEKLGSLNVNNLNANYAWIEYKYDVFPTRSYDTNSGANWEITMDFNTRPVLGSFESSTYFPATPADGRGWYYDAAVSTGDFALEVTNVGTFEETPGWTIMTVNDPNSELYRCDSTFLEKARDFDEDYAETHLGVKLAWEELYDLNWQAMCSQTWTSTDWPYTLYTNWRYAINAVPFNPIFIGLNDTTPHILDLSAAANGGQAAALAVDLLNNNFMAFNSTYPYNDNPGASQFYYSIENTYDVNIYRVLCEYGDPSSASLTVLDSFSSSYVGYHIQAPNIFPGWNTNGFALGSIPLTPSALFTSFGAPAGIPWVPSCRIHGVVDERKVSGITGFQADLPQAGWVYDVTSAGVIGEFGPGKGKIVEENGFVTFFELDAVSPVSGIRDLLIYPKRTAIVKILQSNLGAYIRNYITASAKVPGTDSLGYLKVYSEPAAAVAIFPHQYLEPGVGVATSVIPTPSINSSFPVGNYFNWVQDLDVFYGGGLEDSVLQYAQPYRNVQTYIYEGGELQQYSAENGGWYPSATWGSYNYINGVYTSTAFPLWTTMPYPWNAVASYNAFQYRPIADVTIFNGITGVQLTPITKFQLVLNTLFDGHAMIIDNSIACDFTAFFGSNAYGYPIRITIDDIDGDGEAQTFECVIADAENGILARSVTYFEADGTTTPALTYDWTAYQFENITTATFSTFQTGTQPVLFPGMAVGSFGSTLGFENVDPRIVSYNDETNLLTLNIKQVTGTATYDMYAYSPLDLPFKVQPTNEKVWTRTKQWQSMRLLYEQSFNGAFTWEDSTVSVREKKIPAGSSVLFSSDASDIAGKTGFLWNLYHEGTKLVSITDASFLWTFLEPGDYDLELEITDTNGNKQKKYSKTFVEVYLTEQTEINN